MTNPDQATDRQPDTFDRLRRELLTVADAYCEAKDLSLSRVSTLIFNDGKRLTAIREGKDLYTGRFEQALAFFSEHWPIGRAWPNGIERPRAMERSEP